MPNPITLPDEKPYPEVDNQNAYPDAIDNTFGNFTGTSVNNTQPSGNELNFWNTDAGKQMAANQSAIKSTSIPMPIGTATKQSTIADKPAIGTYTPPEEIAQKEFGAEAMGGVSAGSSVRATPDSQDALLGVAGAGLSGAAAGGAVGGPVGAAVGGIVGLVSGGLNAWVGTHSARQNQRQQEKVNMQIQAREDARAEQSRQDQLYMFNTNKQMSEEQLRYNRRAAAVQESFQAQEAARRAMNEAIANDQNLKAFFLKVGR